MKKSYSDYPPSFLSILDHFSSSDESIKHSLPYYQAASARHQFYRFAQAVYRAETAGDSYAIKLASIAKRISISLVPSHAPAETLTTMTIYVNPLETGMYIRETPSANDAPEIDPGEIERILAERKKP